MFKVIWDKPHNGVILTVNSAGEALSIAPRPVFYEELNLLGLDKRGWVYLESNDPLLWACERRYFYRGILVMEVKGGNLYDDPQVTITPEGDNLNLVPIDIETLREKNSDAMFLIEHEAMEFINSTFRRYKGITKASEINPDIDYLQLATRIEKKTGEKQVVVKEQCDSFDVISETQANATGKDIVLTNKIDQFVVSFSAGKDSQVLLDLVVRVIPGTAFSVIYSDTGYELPTSLEIYEETKRFYLSKHPKLQFYTAQNRQPILYYWDNLGSPSRIHRWCCSVMKSAPLARKLKEINGGDKQPHVLLFDGIRSEESINRSGRSRIGKNVKHNNMINASPIIDWNSTEIYLYILLNGLPVNKSYRNGLARVGCVLCPFFSSWSDDLCGKLYPETIKPFLSWIENSLQDNNVEGVKNYIKNGRWKMRAGGRDMNQTSSINFVSVSPIFKVTLHAPKESLLIWLKILGDYTYTQSDGVINGKIKYKDVIHAFEIKFLDSDSLLFVFYETGEDVILISYLKKIVCKATFCVHCEVCEVECPTGALSVTPIATVNKDKCVHCYKCLEFNSKGCITADSIISSFAGAPQVYSKKTNNMKTTKSSINRYNDGMGLRENWLQKYFNSYDTFFDNEDHGLNMNYQIPPFTNWLWDSKILKSNTKEISSLGLKLQSLYQTNPTLVWEIIFVNLCMNSEICHWFQSATDFERTYTRAELDIIIQDSYPGLMGRSLSNPLNSLINTFKESPLTKGMRMVTLTKQGGKPAITRNTYNDVSIYTIAYSIFLYAELNKRHSLTISEFYTNEQKDGPFRQFGVERSVFERILNTLQEEHNHILDVQLRMGLDNINLREDLTSDDIIKFMD